MDQAVDAALTSPQEALISNASPPPGHSPEETSVALIRSAVVGFWCSLFTLLLVVTIVMLEATEVLWPGFLLGIGFITLLTGFVCSVVAMTRRRRIDRQSHRMAVAGLVISAVVVVAIPILLLLAFFVFLSESFT